VWLCSLVAPCHLEEDLMCGGEEGQVSAENRAEFCSQITIICAVVFARLESIVRRRMIAMRTCNERKWRSGKPLPKSLREVCVGYDHGLVKFRARREAYRAERQLAEFQVVQVGTLDAQVRFHCFLQGADRNSGESETIDVDFYLSIPEFRKASKLLQGIRLKRDKRGVLRVRRWK
jgi:hypothetical protein